MKIKNEGIFALLIVFTFLLGFAIYERYQTQTYFTLSHVNELVAQSISLRENNFDLSLLLSVEAFHRADTPTTKGALLDSVQANPQLIRYLPSDVGSSALAFSPDGNILAIGGKNGTIKFWDVNTDIYIGELVPKWNAPKEYQPKPGESTLGQVSQLIFSPNGKILIESTYTFFADQRFIVLWDVEKGKPITEPLLENKSPSEIVLSPDGNILAISEMGTLSFWNFEKNQFDGQIPLQLFEGVPVGLNAFPVIYSPVFSPDGKTIAAITSVNTITFWDVKTQEAIGQPLMVGELYVNNGVERIIYTKDGKNLLAAYADGSLLSWNLETRKSSQLWHPFQNKDSWMLFGYDAGFNLDGSVAVVRDENFIHLLDTQNGQEISKPLKGIASRIGNLTFSPDGKTLAIANGKTIIIWNLTGSQSLGQNIADHGEAVGFSPAGDLLMAGLNFDEGFPKLALWDPITHDFNNKLDSPLIAPLGVAFSPDGKKLIAGDNGGNVTLWDIKTREVINHLDFGTNGFISSLVFSPDGEMIAIGGFAPEVDVNLWNGQSPEISASTLNVSVYGESSIAFAPNGNTIAVGDTFGAITLWDARTRDFVKWTSTSTSVDSVAFTADGKELATTSRDGKIFLWDVKSRQLLGQPFFQPGSIPDAIAFSPDGKVLVSGNYDDTIFLYDVATRRKMGALIGNSWPINQVIFSPEGQTLITVSNNIMLWDVDPQSWVNKICDRVGRNFTQEEWVQYFPGETYHATCSKWPLDPTTN